jgi:hypothetical protein
MFIVAAVGTDLFELDPGGSLWRAFRTRAEAEQYLGTLGQGHGMAVYEVNFAVGAPHDRGN